MNGWQDSGHSGEIDGTHAAVNSKLFRAMKKMFSGCGTAGDGPALPQVDGPIPSGRGHRRDARDAP